MSKDVLVIIKLIFSAICLSGCGLITKPVGLAKKAVFTPIKAVAGATVDMVSKPVSKATRHVKPIAPVVQIR